MKKLIAIIIALLPLALPAQTGYLVAYCETAIAKPQIVKTTDTLVVDSIANAFLKTNCNHIAKTLKKTVFVEYRQGNEVLYIERKTVKNGRYVKVKNHQ
jgi:uncharacterized protein YxeA